MIHQVLFIENSSAICFFSRDYTGVDISEHMFSGLIKSMRDLAFELSKQDLKSIELGNWLVYYVVWEKFSVVLIADHDDDKKIIKGKINAVANTFLEKFEKEIEDFNGEISQFMDFKEDCDDIFFNDWNFEFNQRVKTKKSD